MVKAIFTTHKTKRSQQEYHFFICQKNRSNCFSDKADAIPFSTKEFKTFDFPTFDIFEALALPQKQSETSQSANKKMTPLLCAAAITLRLTFHRFCKCNKSLYNFISKLHNSDKAIYHTHKIKP